LLTDLWLGLFPCLFCSSCVFWAVYLSVKEPHRKYDVNRTWLIRLQEYNPSSMDDPWYAGMSLITFPKTRMYMGDFSWGSLLWSIFAVSFISTSVSSISFPNMEKCRRDILGSTQCDQSLSVTWDMSRGFIRKNPFSPPL
jgi:hypothetical protein